jgi:hypothetical protein
MRSLNIVWDIRKMQCSARECYEIAVACCCVAMCRARRAPPSNELTMNITWDELPLNIPRMLLPNQYIGVSSKRLTIEVKVVKQQMSTLQVLVKNEICFICCVCERFSAN